MFRFQTRYDGDHYSEMGLGGQGTGFWLDDFVIYKIYSWMVIKG